MTDSRPNVLLACDSKVRNDYIDAVDLQRLEAFANWDWFECRQSMSWAP